MKFVKSIIAGVALVSLLAVGINQAEPANSASSIEASGHHNPGKMELAASGYIYAQGRQSSLGHETSVSGLMDPERPKLDSLPSTYTSPNTHKAVHSLAEFAIGSTDELNYVEVGWTVDGTGVNGTDHTNPHLFTGAWVNGVFQGYNAATGSGWVDYASNATDAGADLSSAVGVGKQFGIIHFNSAWWVSYDGSYIGKYPDTVWSNQGITFTDFQEFTGFGETYFNNTSVPCGQMGDGTTPTATTGAKVSNLIYSSTGGNTPNLTLSAGSPYSAVFYTGSNHSFHFGGPGMINFVCTT